LNKVFEADIAERDVSRLALQEDPVSSLPGGFEVDAVDVVEEVDSVGRNSKLKDYATIFQLGWIPEFGNLPVPEISEGTEQPDRVVGFSIVIDVDVAGHTNVAVEDDRFSSDDHESHFVGVQHPKEILNIGGER